MIGAELKDGVQKTGQLVSRGISVWTVMTGHFVLPFQPVAKG